MRVSGGQCLTTNAGNLAARMRRRSKKYVAAIREATRENAHVLMKQAQNFSRARYYSLKQLAQMGHPYAAAHPAPPKPAHLINRQSGVLHGAWKVSYRPNRDGATATVYNVAPHSRYMMGTRLMIPRPILDEALKRTKAARDRNINRARDRAYRRTR
jgi:hypothetical protein